MVFLRRSLTIRLSEFLGVCVCVCVFGHDVRCESWSSSANGSNRCENVVMVVVVVVVVASFCACFPSTGETGTMGRVQATL